jgi:hypothetical protein
MIWLLHQATLASLMCIKPCVVLIIFIEPSHDVLLLHLILILHLLKLLSVFLLHINELFLDLPQLPLCPFLMRSQLLLPLHRILTLSDALSNLCVVGGLHALDPAEEVPILLS